MKVCDRCKEVGYPIVDTYSFGIHYDNGNPVEYISFKIDLCNKCIHWLRDSGFISGQYLSVKDPNKEKP